VPDWLFARKAVENQSAWRLPAHLAPWIRPNSAMMALIAWASDAGPASARQGSRSARPAPPACGLDRLPTSRRFAAKRSWLVVSASAHFANQLRIAASWSDVAWTSVVLWISQACRSRAMARSHKPCRRHALTETSFDDLYDYVPTRDHPRQRETRRASATWTVTDDWPKDVPVTDAEIDVFEAWFGELFDELFGEG
jgi:hypothetical protein